MNKKAINIKISSHPRRTEKKKKETESQKTKTKLPTAHGKI